MNYTRILAEYAAKLRYEDLPKEVIEQVKELTLHVLGVSLAGCQIRQGKDAIALAKDMGGNKKESTIVGDGSKVSCVQAAFANSTLADVLDWEDCIWTGHPSAGVIPAALAVGETVKASGKQYITAVVVGYEVYVRISMAVFPTHEYRLKPGFGPLSWQIFASAIPAAKLLKVDENKMAQAIGVAATLAPLVNSRIHTTRSDIYHYQYGLTCRDGVVSALMAQKGISNAIYDALDGDTGFWVSVSDNCQWDLMTKGLGEDYLMMETIFKRWPVNMWIQQHMDIVDAIMKEEKVRAGDVAEIIVSPSLTKMGGRMIYRSEGYLGITDAQFSIPYCLAALLLDPEPGPNWFTDEKLKDPKILELAAKVRAVGPELSPEDLIDMWRREGKFVEVRDEIITKDGRRLSKAIHFPKGHPRNPFAPDEHREHFRRSASFMLKPDKIEKAMEKILKLEEVADISEVARLMHN
jgi:2-methylcitrate dehydratase PrpD